MWPGKYVSPLLIFIVLIMRKLFLTVLFTLLCVVTFAQTSALRDKGYKGSVSLLYQGLACAGLETSHGVMLNQHHYLGVGGGAFVFPDGKGYPSFAEAFLDYQAYILKKDSTPIVGFKTGYIRSLFYGKEVNGYVPGYNFKQGLSLQPEVGWSWALNPKYGISVSAGANFIFPMEEHNKVLYITPRAAITFEF